MCEGLLKSEVSFVLFIFDNINLPDSTSNEVNSHGYIAYKIKPKSTSAIGDIFNNSAEIYFDYNPAIYTNMVETEVVDVLAVPTYQLNSFTLYPNPTNGMVNIKARTAILNVDVFNYLGQKVISQGGEAIIDMSSLSRGMYFVAIKDTMGNEEVKKVIRR